jgi:hypothetical protein
MGRERAIIRLLIFLISIPLSRLLRKLSLRVWGLVRPAPAEGEQRSTSARAFDMASYAAIAAAASVAARILTRKAAAKSYEKLMGTPAPPEEVAW